MSNCSKPEIQHSVRLLSRLKPAPENDTLYRPVRPDDPEIIELARSIRQHGLREPIVITEDDFILSGHRRHAACKLAGLETVPVRIEPIWRDDDIDDFVVLLREYNRQRDKTESEKLREELVTISPTIAYQSLIEQRNRLANVEVDEIVLNQKRNRHSISKNKEEFRKAIIKLVFSYQDHWPLTDRRIHYYLLNDPPMKNTGKAHRSRYANDKSSYNNLTDMLTRMRLNGDIPFRSISDETRPVVTWECFQSPRGFLRKELNQFCQSYWRDLMQTQPNHIEILGEKNTVWPTIRKVAMRYRIPVTSGRGHASLDPRLKMFHRYQQSGKQKLILIVASDFDPAGECIAESFCRSMRDDFGVEDIVPIKAALTHQQTQELDLSVDGLTPKTKDKQRKAFEAKYGNDQKCYELEALPPETLESILTDAVDSVIDQDLFNAELECEEQDAAFIAATRNRVTASMKELLEEME